jgi:uncharacterized Rmd1/YagE family protein
VRCVGQEWSIIWLIAVEVVFVLLDHPGIVDPTRWLFR